MVSEVGSRRGKGSTIGGGANVIIMMPNASDKVVIIAGIIRFGISGKNTNVRKEATTLRGMLFSTSVSENTFSVDDFREGRKIYAFRRRLSRRE